MDERDTADVLFDELAHTTSGKDLDPTTKNKSFQDSSRRLLARAFDIELTTGAGIDVSPKKQQRIDKLLSDVAELLQFGEEAEESSEYFRSARPATEDVSNEKAPIFKSAFETTVSESTSFTEVVPKDEPVRPERVLSCFNCCGVHNVADCPEPKDLAKIRRNRSVFQLQQKAAGITPQRRYHMEKDSKFNLYSPGKVSDNLREALGIRPGDLPPWIYEMRILGYPPGHLRVLLEPPTKLAIYNDSEDSSLKTKADEELDASKLVKYPGFNVPLTSGIRDDHHKYGYPPMLDEHLEERFLASVTATTGKRFAESCGSEKIRGMRGTRFASNGTAKDDVRVEPPEQDISQSDEKGC